jgi:hypothetical protein
MRVRNRIFRYLSNAEAVASLLKALRMSEGWSG